jgi:hypothetical protein
MFPQRTREFAAFFGLFGPSCEDRADGGIELPDPV